eukprot:350247-Chlamydomonas_euryale.AAC.5
MARATVSTHTGGHTQPIAGARTVRGAQAARRASTPSAAACVARAEAAQAVSAAAATARWRASADVRMHAPRRGQLPMTCSAGTSDGPFASLVDNISDPILRAAVKVGMAG